MKINKYRDFIQEMINAVPTEKIEDLEDCNTPFLLAYIHQAAVGVTYEASQSDGNKSKVREDCFRLALAAMVLAVKNNP